MCPLRLVLIFLSATLAGFFVLRSLKTRSDDDDYDDGEDTVAAQQGGQDGSAGNKPQQQQQELLSCSAKIGSAVSSGFWTCVDMASGRYLWRNLVSSSPPADFSSSSAPKKNC